MNTPDKHNSTQSNNSSENKQSQPKPKDQTMRATHPTTASQNAINTGELMKDYTFSATLNHLLKKPLIVIHSMHLHGKTPLIAILTMTLVSLALFGFIVGSFHGAQEQMWAAPVKIITGVLFSSLICLPSLYIFCCLGGLDTKFSNIFNIQVCTMAITSLLLIGFAPVLWLFSSSSESILFFGFLTLLIWIICLIFGLKFLNKAGRSYGMIHTKHLYLWSIIFSLVTLQMPTTLRPIIGNSEQFLQLEEKKFFLQHWSEQLSSPSSYNERGQSNHDTINRKTLD